MPANYGTRLAVLEERYSHISKKQDEIHQDIKEIKTIIGDNKTSIALLQQETVKIAGFIGGLISIIVTVILTVVKSVMGGR